MIDESRFISRMTRRWKKDYGNQTTTELANAWKIILSAFNDQLEGKQGLLTCDAVCGTGKTTSLQEACGLLAGDNPSVGGLIVVRLISQANEVAEGINKASKREVAIPLHSGVGGQHSEETINNSQFVVITHARYLASVSPSGGRMSFRQWVHGERKLRVCDESLDLVERHTLTQRELQDLYSRLSDHKRFFSHLEDQFEIEYDFLRKVARKVGKGQQVMGFREGLFDEILNTQSEPIYLSSFLSTLIESPREEWYQCKTAKGIDPDAYFQQWKEETISYIQTFDRIVRYRRCFLDQFAGESRLSIGTFLLPESFDSLVVLDATSNVDAMYKYFKNTEVTRYEVPRNVRNFKNARLHFRPDASGLGKNETKKTMAKRIPQVLRWANERFSKEDKVLFAGHKVLVDAMKAVLTSKDYEFVSKKFMVDGTVEFQNIDFAHYGIIDGQNKWRDYDNLVILSIPYLPTYYSPTAMMALRGDDQFLEDREDIASSNIAVKIIQLICRIVVRMVSDKRGNCPEADIYLLLDGDEPFPGDVNYRPLLKKISTYLLDQIELSLHNITVDNWESFNGFQTRTSNSVPKGGVTDSFITWITQLEPDTPTEFKVFLDSMGLTKQEVSSLSAQISKSSSPVKRALQSKNVRVVSKRGTGRIFTKEII